MRRLASLIGLLCVIACGTGPEASVEPTEVVEPTAPAPEILERPFTAEQIRDEWVEGLEIKIRRWTPEAEIFEMWTVVAADAEGVDIESVVYGTDGVPREEPSVQRSGWVELRDHATFPAGAATRESTVRQTPLGELAGWLYTVPGPTAGSVNEFFFAESLPGAPVFVHVLQNGERVEIFEQVERKKP